MDDGHELATIEEEIAAVVQPLRDLDEKLSREEAQLVAELAQVRDKRRKLLTMLRTADPVGYPTKVYKRQTPRAPYSTMTIAPKTIERVLAAIGGLEGEFTAVTVRQLLPDLGKDTVRKGLIRLREAGQVRLVRQGSSRTGGSVYVVTPRGRIDAAPAFETSTNSVS